MPAPEPPRDTKVWFFGAGLSSAFGLPNTPALLKELETALRPQLSARLRAAYKFLYPDATYDHYQPDVVDFFSSLSAFVGVGQGWPGTGLKDSQTLLRELKRAIAHLLITRTKEVDGVKLRKHPYLTEAVQPGHVIVTTNWDPLVERHAELREVPLRRSRESGRFSTSGVTLLKLHGSVDWTSNRTVKRSYDHTDYASLTELQTAGRQYRVALPSLEGDVDQLVRIRAYLGDMWSRVSSRTYEPWIVTMVTGKQDELGPLQAVWRDAYAALGRADRVEIAGYSLPPDDIEVRTLIRAGVMRGRDEPALKVVDPSPPVHARFRSLITHQIESDYGGVPRA
ncbi:SIR2 family protein [Myceligenerans indicum]|uniref:SIR2-like domain-containing protein n=1 Tax=Myceligenerans indicum TaxID=2593663 RepID=A0ABS1LJG5_9MICO|nr:SIR2 family protein [Myceligenerans indicum]MBL0886390.1 hypothetical protein [Myceligenerans indicum]